MQRASVLLSLYSPFAFELLAEGLGRVATG